MGTLIRENKRKIALSLNMGLLLMGCLMLTIGAYPALYSGGANETRLSIGATCIAFWFISFVVHIPMVLMNACILSNGLTGAISVLCQRKHFYLICLKCGR